jgi:hypothetical protein
MHDFDEQLAESALESAIIRLPQDPRIVRHSSDVAMKITLS